jgi:hypothetical protein
METKTDWARLSEEAMEDRRKGKRVKLRFDLEVIGAEPDGRAYTMQASTRDVSEVGCSFEIARPMIAGDDVALRVKRKNEAGTVKGTGPLVFHVMWVKRERDLSVVGAEMIVPGDPWKIAFPPKIVNAKPS